ncbi:hypothetical protein BDV09DRAFT_160409, partial [Aspergillus tetrazonus]
MKRNKNKVQSCVASQLFLDRGLSVLALFLLYLLVSDWVLETGFRTVRGREGRCGSFRTRQTFCHERNQRTAEVRTSGPGRNWRTTRDGSSEPGETDEQRYQKRNGTDNGPNNGPKGHVWAFLDQETVREGQGRPETQRPRDPARDPAGNWLT